MIWLTWRQFRSQAMVVFGVLAVVAVALALTGPTLVHVYDTTVATCAVHDDCSSVTNAFTGSDRLLQQLSIVLVFVSALIGIFWGAPLVARELETGTYRLAWTQSVTRTRWVAVKLGVVGLTSVAVAGLLSLMVTWWSSPIDRATMNLYGTFDQRGVVPVGYAAFAFALGVTAGVLIRRMLPAMATTLVAYVVVRWAVSTWVRPHLVAPLHSISRLNAASMGFGITNGGPPTLHPNVSDMANISINKIQIVDAAGHALTSRVLASDCPGLLAGLTGGGTPSGGVHRAITPAPVGVQNALQACVAKVGVTYHEVLTYQPSSHYWPLQGLETAVYLVLALLLVGASLWWVRHRLA
jgi:hypothetical protein